MPEHPLLSRADTLVRLDQARRSLNTALAGHGWERPTATGWTAKDHLAHVVAWQRRLIAWFSADAAGRVPHRPEPGYRFDQVDELNARDHRRDRELPPEALTSDFHEAHAAIVRIVEWMNDEDLAAPDRFEWLGHPASEAIAEHSYAHYFEHAAMVEAAPPGS